MKLLVLDDDREYLERFAELCAEANLPAPTEARTIADALIAVRVLRAEGEPFVCFVDLGLHDETGLDFMPRLEEIGVVAPVAILSDTDEQEEVFLSAQRGAAAFYAKDDIITGANVLQAIASTVSAHFEQLARSFERRGVLTDATAAIFGEFIHDVQDLFVPIEAAANEIAAAADDSFLVAEAETIVDLAQQAKSYLDVIKEYRETGFIQCQRCACDVSEVVRSVWDGIARSLDQLVVEVGEGLVFNVDRRGVERIFASLITNVKVHVPEGALVQVKIHRRVIGGQRYCTCLFGDDGPGIPRADWDKVFLPGGRSGGSDSGSGLGLAIAQRWVDVHRLEGAPASMQCAEGPNGAGAWFEINLPEESSP